MTNAHPNLVRGLVKNPNLIVIAGNLLARRNIAYSVAFIERGKVRVRCFAVVHVSGIVQFKIDEALVLEIRERIYFNKFLNMWWKLLQIDSPEGENDIPVQLPDESAGRNGPTVGTPHRRGDFRADAGVPTVVAA